MSDAKLDRSARQRSHGDGLRTLYRRYAGELYGFALNSLHDRGLAEEVVQDAFTSVWRHADRFDPDHGSFRTWLYGLARNRIVDMRRRAAVRPALAAMRSRARSRPSSTARSTRRCCAGRWRRRSRISARSTAR